MVPDQPPDKANDHMVHPKLTRGGFLRKMRLSPGLTVAITTGLLTLLVTITGHFLEGYYALQLEARKFEESVTVERHQLRKELILEAIRTPSGEEAKKNLLFLIESGILEDDEGKIAAALAEPDSVPSLTPLQGRIAQLEVQVKALKCQLEGRAFDVLTLECLDVPARERSRTGE